MKPDDTVAVLGAGTMGAGISQVAAAAGHPVLLYDVRTDAAAKAINDIRINLQKLVAKGKLSAEAAAAARVTSAASIGQLGPAGLVIEAIVEDLTAKREVFAKLENIIAEDCILATNTSSISVTAIAAALQRPGRLAGMHFFNPAPIMELVEVVSGLATDRDCAETIYATAKAWGKTPVRVKSSPGFIVNRVARPFYLEALKLLQERVATPATIDAVMREAGGFRMGPFELMDLIGNDVNLAVSKSLFEAFFYEPRFRPSLLQQELVDAGRLGRKTGRGWYDYADGAVKPMADPEPPADLIVQRILTAIADEAQRVVDEGICTAEDLNLAMRKGVNYPMGPLEWRNKL
jgi:3-hydroxybutyryl-CoA dehydrogenase